MTAMAHEPYSSDKPYLIVHADTPMSCAMRCAQGAHASFGTYGTDDKGRRKAWRRDGKKKVVPTAPHGRALHDSGGIGGQNSIPSVVHGTNVTGIPPGAITLPGHGPAKSKDQYRITTIPSHL